MATQEFQAAAPNDKPHGQPDHAAAAQKAARRKVTARQRFIREAHRAMTTIIALSAAGALVVAVYALQTASVAQFASVFAVAATVAVAAFCAGGLLGFLFGIPRTSQPDSSNGGFGYQANTNLEQISDWLTKILVGVGLTQLITLPDSLQKYSVFMAPGLGSFPSSPVFAVALLVYYLVCGFLLAYLWTRLYLAGALHQSDLDAAGRLERVEAKVSDVQNKVSDVQNTVSDLEKQERRDVEALTAIQQQLNPSAGSPPITFDQLAALIQGASPDARDRGFQKADRVVQDAIDGKVTPANVAQTPLIFRALIANDTYQLHHEYHGTLGLALELQSPPDSAGAEAALTTAIKLRGDPAGVNYLVWEFYRARSRIEQDVNYNDKKPSDPATAAKIRTDIDASIADPNWGNTVSDLSPIKEWLALNPLPAPGDAPPKIPTA